VFAPTFVVQSLRHPSLRCDNKGYYASADKLDQTHGRSRQKTSIGIYLDLIKPPIHYVAVKPSDVAFVPLGFLRRCLWMRSGVSSQGR
jgi:hypothetical protein